MVNANRRVAFTLAVLFGINTMNFFDRQILSAVQEQLPTEWNLTDTRIGWLGTAFILLYAIVGLPLGRFADVWRRKWILAIGIGVWSVLTALSGLAWNFWSLFVFRLGVGVGEAACAPAASSLIGDLFPAERRARAMSIFMIGLPLGLGLSFIVSGTVTQYFGWRPSFFLAGIPGVLLAFAALFMLDPPRGSADAEPLGRRAAGVNPPVANGAHLPFLVVVKNILRLPTMWWIILSGALHNFNMYALGTFLSSFLQRYHGIEVAEAGWISGLVYGLGAIGMFLAGMLGDRAFRKHVSGRLVVAWAALAIAIPFMLLSLSIPRGSDPDSQRLQGWLFAAAFLPASMMLYGYYGTVYASIQDIIAPQFRGTAMAIYFCAMYLLGAVWGPVATGVLSDHFSLRAAHEAGVQLSAGEKIPPEYRALGLHQAMYVVPICCGLLVLVLYAASRTVGRDRERLLNSQARAAPS